MPHLPNALGDFGVEVGEAVGATRFDQPVPAQEVEVADRTRLGERVKTVQPFCTEEPVTFLVVVEQNALRKTK